MRSLRVLSLDRAGWNRREGSRVAFFQNWAIPIIVADFALLPMFHIGSIPWKPGYLTVLLASLVYARGLPRREIMVSRQVFAVMATLIAVTLVGVLIFDVRTASSGVSLLSLRPLLVYALGALAFLVGTADRRDRHDYLLLIVGGFFFVNLIHNALAADWGWLADFYNTQELGRGETYGRDVRVPGVMSNPNLTALMATILLMFMVTGFRSGFVRPSRGTATAIIAMSGAIVVVMMSRNQVLAIAIVAGAGISYLPRRMVFAASLSVILVGVVSWWGLTFIGDDRQNQLLGLKLTESFGGRWVAAGIGRTNVSTPPVTEVTNPPSRADDPPVLTTLFSPTPEVIHSEPKGQSTDSATGTNIGSGPEPTANLNSHEITGSAATVTADPNTSAVSDRSAGETLNVESNLVTVPLSTELSTPPQGEAISPPPDSIDESQSEAAVTPTLDVPGESDTTTGIFIFNDALFRDDGIARPLKNFGIAYERWAISPIFGTGYEGSPKFSSPGYHNDWATVFAASGLVGLAAFAFLGLTLVRINPLLGVPLLLPGLTNSFLTAPQHFVLLMLLAGLIVSRRWGPKARDVGNPAPAPVDN